MDFHIKLKSVRETFGYKQTDVASKLKLPKTTYNGYETGKRQPDFEMLVKLAHFFNCSTDYLLGTTTVTTNNLNKDLSKLNLQIAERIKQRINTLNISFSDFIDLINIESEIMLSIIEGDNPPSIKNLKKISVALETTTDYLLGLTENSKLPPKPFTERIQGLMIQKNITKKSLAATIEISISDVENYINGNDFPNIETLKKLAIILNTTIDYLVGLNDKS